MRKWSKGKLILAGANTKVPDELREEIRTKEKQLNDEGRRINWIKSIQERRQMNLSKYIVLKEM